MLLINLLLLMFVAVVGIQRTRCKDKHFSFIPATFLTTRQDVNKCRGQNSVRIHRLLLSEKEIFLRVTCDCIARP